MNNLKRYQEEEFCNLLPSLKQILSQFELDETEKEFKYKDLYSIAFIHVRLSSHQEIGCRQHQPASFSKVVNR